MTSLDSLYQDNNNQLMLRPKPFTEGVITAVSCAPEIPMPPQWMPWVFDQSATTNTDLDWESITDALVKSLRDTLSLLRNERLPLPELYAFDPDNPTTSSQAKWLSGFLFAHQQLQPTWQKAWECLQKDSADKAEEAGKTLRHCLKVMSVLADPDAVADKVDNQDWLAQLPEISATLPRILKQYSQLADELAGYLPNQFEQFTQL